MSPMWRSLSVRNYRLFVSGQLVSLTGTWMQTVAQDWLVLDLTGGSGAALGLVTALQFLPMLLFGLWGGVLADRYPKRRLLVGAQVAYAVLAVTLGSLVAFGSVQLWMVYLFALLLGLTTVVDVPARQSFIGEMVGPDSVANAVGLNSATFNVARLLGPALAGLLITGGGTALVFLINGVSYTAVIAGLMRMRPDELFSLPRVPRAKGQLRAGLRYVRGRADLMLPMVLIGVVAMVGFNFQLTLAMLTRETFGRGAGTYGLLTSLFALGSLGGALVAARRGRPRQAVYVGAAITFGLLEMLTGLAPTLPLVAILLVPTGVATITLAASCNATVQLGSSPQMRGRTMALYSLVFLGGTPLGAPFAGWLAEHAGPRAALVAGGALSAAAGAVIGLLLLRRDPSGWHRIRTVVAIRRPLRVRTHT